jgi:hypothetical protein
MMFFGLFFTIAVVVGIVLLVAWAARGFKGEAEADGIRLPARLPGKSCRRATPAVKSPGISTSRRWRIFAEAGP